MWQSVTALGVVFKKSPQESSPENRVKLLDYGAVYMELCTHTHIQMSACVTGEIRINPMVCTNTHFLVFV
jgi:hypothetical protein